jgi:GNAT superfamily N-acetyltransferase
VDDETDIRQVTDPHDPAVEAFGKLQRSVYYEPQALIPASAIGWMLSSARGGRENFFIVAERAGKLLGGVLFHYLKAADSGFSSFMGVTQEARGQGIARALHVARFDALRAASSTLAGVFIDVVNPERMSNHELEAETRVGSDPWRRRKIFGHLGFRKVDVRYEQPVGGPNGGPVTILDLLYCPIEPTDSVSTQLVTSTMQAYWGGWLGVEAAKHHADELGRRAGGPTIRLVEP